MALVYDLIPTIFKRPGSVTPPRRNSIDDGSRREFINKTLANYDAEIEAARITSYVKPSLLKQR